MGVHIMTSHHGGVADALMQDTSIGRLLLMLAGLASSACVVPANQSGSVTAQGDGLPGSVVFPGHTATVDCYCVPNLIAIPGRLVAIAEARILNCDDSAAKTITSKASDDGGRSWQPEVAIVQNSSFTNAGGAVWDDHSNALLVTYATNGPCAACPWNTCQPPACDCDSGCRNIWLVRSTDKGRSFSKGRNISEAIWNHPRTCSGGSKCVYGEFINPGPTKGVQLMDGTLVFVVVDITSQVPGMPGGGIVSIRSTDFGASWLAGKPLWVSGWSETAIVRLGGDRLLANGRCSDLKTCGNGAVASRYIAVSEDAGLTWGAPTTPPRIGVRGAICDGDMVMLGNGTLLFSHPAGLSHMDDTAFNGTFRSGDCFAYPHQVPGKKCAAIKDCPFSVDAPCRSNLTILSSKNNGQDWHPWASDFWPGYTVYPWAGGGSAHFPARAGYSSLVGIQSHDSASGQDEVAVLFESVGTMGPLRLIRFSMDGKVLQNLKTDDECIGNSTYINATCASATSSDCKLMHLGG